MPFLLCPVSGTGNMSGGKNGESRGPPKEVASCQTEEVGGRITGYLKLLGWAAFMGKAAASWFLTSFRHCEG